MSSVKARAARSPAHNPQHMTSTTLTASQLRPQLRKASARHARRHHHLLWQSARLLSALAVSGCSAPSVARRTSSAAAYALAAAA